MTRYIDLRSDTVTRPTPGMREAMARAEVGDDVYGEDPTVNALQQRAAALFGKEAALFVPSGTMANLLAALAQSRPGDAMLLADNAHPFNYEAGNLALVAGLLTRPVPSVRGLMAPEDVRQAIVALTPDHHFAPTTLVAIENTVNRGGGAIYPLETAASIGRIARENGLRCHCDGARIFHAVVETGVAPAAWAAHADTLSFCLSKGLGCPVGSLLVGDVPTIDAAHRYRKMLGGGMRQAGILAAAGLYALDHHVERLRDDHRRARAFREAVEAAGFESPYPAQTNMVYIRTEAPAAFAANLAEKGVRVGVAGVDLVRAVFHLEIDDAGAAHAAEAVAALGPSHTM